MFNEQVVIITGAGQGIGATMVKNFAKEGAQVIAIDFNQDTVEAVAEEIKADGGKAVAYQADVSKFDRAAEVIEDIFKKFGHIDVLVNNAGITRDARLVKMTEGEWDAVIATNLKGTFNYTKLTFEKMVENNYGRIINFSSIAGVAGNFGQTNYSASKAGVIGLTKTVAIEGGAKGITVNAIAPGFIRTPMTDAIPDKVKEGMIASIPVKRIGEPEDLYAAAKYLASKEAGFITGQVLEINGGMHIG